MRRLAGVWILLVTPPAIADEKFCDQAFVEACQTSVRLLEVTRDMDLFHWFTTHHYNPGESSEDYVERSLESFLKTSPAGKDAGAAGTGGLYLATDPAVSCNYGDKITDYRKPVLAVLRVPPGARVAFVDRNSANKKYSQLTKGKRCLYFSTYYSTAMALKCNEGVKADLVAYEYVEVFNYVERKAFSGYRVAFTAGKEAVARDKAKLQILSWEELLSGQSLETAVISSRVGNRRYTLCPAQSYLKKYKNSSVTEAQKKEWEKKYWLSESGSLEFFKALNSEVDLTKSVESASQRASAENAEKGHP